ncbi:MAG TPA: uracil-DNA glycosylase [Hyphomicrobiaceae bacterium]|nr:uracil-DNA glycosylase [Hyphomicrobiaceae bacterium]
MSDRPLPPFDAFRADDVVAAVENALRPTSAVATKCTLCVLSETRTKVVFGAGSARSGIVLIGEAPGANEDAQGLPFVGRSGQLLNRLLAEAGIARADVYICNVVKCRPPGNRDPRPEEVGACAPFLREQLEALKPRVLCALGLHATRWLLPGKEPMAKLRGRALDYKGIATIATYHPAAILRSPRLKDNAVADLGLVRRLAEQAAAREVAGARASG